MRANALTRRVRLSNKFLRQVAIFSPDASFVLVISDGAQLLDAKTGDLVHEYE